MNKKPEIDAQNALFFLLVVFIHVSSEPIQRLDRQSLEFGIIMSLWHLASFVMQGFVFLSGLKLFLRDGDGFNYPRFILRRFRKIYLPFVIWTSVYYIYLWQRGYYEISLPRFGLYLLRGNIVSPFYFIVVIMQFYLLMPLWRLMVRAVPPAAGIAASLFIMLIMKQMPIPYNDRIFSTYLLYWAMGCYAGRRYEVFISKITRRAGLALICAAAAAGAFDVFLKLQKKYYLIDFK